MPQTPNTTKKIVKEQSFIVQLLEQFRYGVITALSGDF